MLKRVLRPALFVSGLLFLLFFYGFSVWMEQSSLLGVLLPGSPRAMTAAQLEQAEPLENGALYFNGSPLPRDRQEGIFYCPVDTLEHLPTGALTFEWGGVTLQWGADEYAERLQEGIAQGHPFPLYIVREDAVYLTHVCFVNLSLLSLSGSDQGLALETRDVELPVTGQYFQPSGSCKSFSGTFALRGATSMIFPKKCYKLELAPSSGKLSPLGLVADDDWVLNAMYTDPSCVRETLIATLWNSLVEAGLEQHAMAKTEYTVLFYNDTCLGLYALGNRLAANSLNLDRENDLLFKGVDWDQTLDWDSFWNTLPDRLFGPYELKWPKQDNNEHSVWQPLQQYYALFHGGGGETLAESSLYRLDNQLDYSIFCELFALFDNKSSRNVYYVGTLGEHGYTFDRLLWDTDISFDFDTLAWRYPEYTAEEFATQDLYQTVEMEALLEQLPETRALYAQRWALLRQDLLSDETIIQTAQQLGQHLIDSGGYAVENRYWYERFAAAELSPIYNCLEQRSAAVEAMLEEG